MLTSAPWCRGRGTTPGQAEDPFAANPLCCSPCTVSFKWPSAGWGNNTPDRNCPQRSTENVQWHVSHVDACPPPGIDPETVNW